MKRLKLGIIGLGIGRYYLDALRQSLLKELADDSIVNVEL